MAATGLSDVKIDDGVVTQLASLQLVKNLQLLEAGTGIIAAVDREEKLREGGQFISMPRVADIAGLAERVDTDNPTTDVTPKKLEANLENRGVVRVLRLGPVQLSEIASQIGVGSQAEFETAVAEIMAKAAAMDVKKWLYRALAGAIPAIKLDVHGGTESDNRHIHDIFVDALTGQATLTHARALAGMAKLGDAFTNLSTWLMHSKVAFDVFGEKLESFKIDSVAGDFIKGGIYSFFGRRIIVDDDCWTEPYGGATGQGSDLSGSSPMRYWTFLLGPAALQVGYQRELRILSDSAKPTLTKESVITTIRGDMSFVAHVRLMKYAGAANPTAAQFIDPANWDEAYSDHKEVLAAAIKHN